MRLLTCLAQLGLTVPAVLIVRHALAVAAADRAEARAARLDTYARPAARWPNVRVLATTAADHTPRPAAVPATRRAAS